MQGEILNPKEMNTKQRGASVCSASISPSREFAYTNNNFQQDNEKSVCTISGNFNAIQNGADMINTKLPTLRRKTSVEFIKEGCLRRFFYSRTGPNNIHLLIAEFVGTGLLLFIGCMGCLNPGDIDRPEYISGFAFGLAVMIIIQMFGHISGAHLNPAVTMVTALSGIIELKSVPFYILGQFGGAIVGFGGLKMLMPEEYITQDFFDEKTNQSIHKQGFCTNNINAKLSPAQGCIVEATITFVLIIICYSIWDKRNAAKQDSVPLRFGLVISCIAIASGPFTGGSMNTARSFAPALLNNDWENHWIYWIGPTAGALIAHYFYKFLYAVPDDEVVEEEYEEVAIQSINDAKV